MTSKELLSCPLCDGEVEHHTYSGFHYGSYGYKTKSEDFCCKDCGLLLRVRGDEVTRLEAFDKWNTRAAQDPQVKQPDLSPIKKMVSDMELIESIGCKGRFSGSTFTAEISDLANAIRAMLAAAQEPPTDEVKE